MASDEDSQWWSSASDQPQSDVDPLASTPHLQLDDDDVPYDISTFSSIHDSFRNGRPEMAEPEDHYTVFIRLPFNRGDFVDPPPVAWSATKERELWDILSRQSKDNEVDWKSLSDRFAVTEQFLLQQAAWLYERQLSQVRAQMRRMGNRSSATASPAPNSTAGSVVGVQPRQKPAVSSRGPSRLSMQSVNAAPVTEVSTPTTPLKSKSSFPFRSSTGTVTSPTRGAVSTSRPLSRKSSRDEQPTSRTHSRRGSIQHQLPKSPAQIPSADFTSSEDETEGTKTTHRRPNPASTQRRTQSMRKSQHLRRPSVQVEQLEEETEEDEDTPAFLPFVETSPPSASNVPQHDPSATIRGGLVQAQSTRPPIKRNVTSERIRTSAASTARSQPQSQTKIEQNPPLNSSNSSFSSSSAAGAPPRRPPQPPPGLAHRTRQPNLPTPLSPQQQAALATAAGLSPRRRSTNPHQGAGSESSPSMGSSFSDLDDASVTQSALEEALMSGMGSTATTGTMAGLGSRVGGIGQALRSRYFDPRPGTGAGAGAGNNGNGSPQK